MSGERPGDPAWTLVYEGFDPEQEGHREALLTLGNGRFATRGCVPEASADEVHYPGTYVAGGYNRLVSEIAGRSVVNEDLVNLPNWLPVGFRPAGGRWLRWSELELLDYRAELRMREGLLVRLYRVRDPEGRETALAEERIVHMGRPRVAALRYRITPENWKGPVEISSSIDGSVTNGGVARYRQLASKHLEVIDRGAVAPGGIFLTARTVQSRLEVVVAARTRVFRDGERLEVDLGRREEAERIEQRGRLELSEGEGVTLEKVVALCTSRDHAVSEASHDARLMVTSLGDFEELRDEHAQEWTTLWRRFDLELGPQWEENRERAEERAGLARTQLTLRLHVFHLLQTCSQNTVDLDVGVPARGLHGEAYRGHIFWDEVFIHPLYDLHLPEIARSLLLYRHRRLEMARRNATEAGFEGALFPWQSGSNGVEETQVLHLNPMSGEWGPDHSRLQRHINAAVAYNIWRYHHATGDLQFLRLYGAEMLLEIARFWSSAASFDPERERWVIRGVMGPDEYQEKYPEAEAGGIDNNAYTNVMAVWCLEVALESLDVVGGPRAGELRRRLHLSDGELDRWRSIVRRMFVPFLPDGVIEQFEGYRHLEEFDWEGYAERYGDIQRLDRILEAEGDSTDRYKASKQADVNMLFFLLSREELSRIFDGLGYAFDDDSMRRTVEYYRRRSSHGSTLSRVVYASVLNLIDRDEGWRLFQEALRSDLDDIQGGTTSEGIHLGAMAGTVDIVLRRYAGVTVTRREVCFEPEFPPQGSGLRFRVEHRHQWIEGRLDPDRLVLTLDESAPRAVPVRVHGKRARLRPGEPREFDLRGRGAGRAQAGTPG
jgi:trehalose/maltose hydrolase-like predicted phosphorylase